MKRERFEAITKFCNVLFLDEALTQRIKEAPPRAKARIMSHWSYIEGVWAEELLRANRQAEEAALLAEAMVCMAHQAGKKHDHAGDLRVIWHTILKYQHHDVWWIEITDLRRKAIGYLQEVVEKCRGIMQDIAESVLERVYDHVAFFNGLPWKRTALIDGQRDPSLGFIPGLQEYEGRQLGFLDLPAGGYRSFPLQKSAASTSTQAPLPESIRTKFYDVRFTDAGLVSQITADGYKLLATGEYLGGEIRALIADEWHDNRTASCRFSEGNVCYIIERAGSVAAIPLVERYFFYRDERLIKVELEFEFHHDEVGVFWFDETKLNIYYPCVAREIHHDIHFGYVKAREHRPLFATNWIACGGLVFVNRGNVKHWIRDGVLANVIAWGGNVFGNRLHFDFWASKREYDIRLDGKHIIEYYIVPYGEFDGAEVVQKVSELTWPVFGSVGKGFRAAYESNDRGFEVTSIYNGNDGIYARGYGLPKTDSPSENDFKISSKRLLEPDNRSM